MMRDDLAIRLSSVGIKFRLSLNEGQPLKERRLEALRQLLARRQGRDFWALRDINLEVRRGEILGIIGGNGAGKSTLLKIIAGIYPATAGQVEVKGAVAPLIELGAAFNPELTGAENIFFAGSIYRIPRRVIRQNFDRIVDFAGLRRFIHSPVKNYSTGMFMRLAFSLVIFFEPDIVLIDEVFAVGDEVFQQKSFEKILSFRERGATLLLVSHDLNLIQNIATRCLVLSQGKISYDGSPEGAVRHYQELILRGEGLGQEERPREGREKISPGSVATGVGAEAGLEIGAGERFLAADRSRRWGDRQVEITSVTFVDERGEAKRVFAPGDYFEARIGYVSRLPEAAEEPVFGVAINTIYKMLLYGPNTLAGEVKGKVGRKGVVRFIIPQLPLFSGDYLFSAAVYDQSLSHAFDHHEMMYHFRVVSPGAREFGCVRLAHHWLLE